MQSKIPIFQQYWWMEVVCSGKQWDVALVMQGDKVLGALPYLIGSKCGMRYIVQPQLTQFNGPWYNYEALESPISESHRLRFECEVANKLIDSLSSLHLTCYQQCFSPTVTNWLPFYWRGFRQSTRYTYRIENIENPDLVFQSFDVHERQRKITRNKERLQIVETHDAAWFAQFHADYWNRKGKQELLPFDLVVRVANEAIARHQGALLRLENEWHQAVAAAFVIYDSNQAHLQMTAYSHDYYKSDHVTLLIWQLIQWLSSRTKAFDFEGSMIRGKEYFNRSFGTCQTPYFMVCRYANPLISFMMRNRR
ncbi:MAG: GNAT family N-acetyltransferase [Bacteroidales bacterium]|nr:GNAT family N-acetyltransferase [Candidatus Colimorpha onthohippi]